MEQKVVNPETGRTIKVGGTVYNRLVASGVILQAKQSYIPSPSPQTKQSYLPSPSPQGKQSYSPSPSPQGKQSYLPSPSPQGKQSPLPNPKTIPIPITNSGVIVSNKLPHIPGTIPNVNTFTKSADMIVQQELQEREKTCSVCDELYVERIKNLRPFHRDELATLRKIAANCKRCHELHTYADSRSGNANPKTSFYANVTNSCDAKIKELEDRLAYDTLQFLHSPAIPKRPDIDFLFPKIPKSSS